MRNLKKVLALVVAVAMIASMGLVASAASYTDVASTASYADAVNLLSNLGVINGFEDGTFRPTETVTRAQAAKMIVCLLGEGNGVETGDTQFTDVDGSHWASGYINVAVARGILNGMGDGTFAPEATLTYGQIVKMIVCALGYEPVATANGGWANGGYIVAGSKAGFTKGVAGTADAAASRATVALLMYNALEVELMEQDGYSTGIYGDTFKVQEGKTILTEYLGLEKVEGVVTATPFSNADVDVEEDATVSIVVTKADDDAELAVVGTEVVVLVTEGVETMDLLGRSVVAYVGEDEEYDEPLLYAIAEKAGKNTVVTLDTELIKEFDGETLVYSKSETSKKTTEAAIDNVITFKGDVEDFEVENNAIVNGFATTLDVVLEAYDTLEEISFIDNDGDGDFEFVVATVATEDSLEFVIDEVDAEEYVITDTEGEEYVIDLEDETLVVTIVKDGAIVEFDALAEGDVVTILEPEAKLLTIYVSSVKVEGVVEEVEADVYTIAGKDYEISGLSALELEAGDEGIFYINASGKIVASETVSTLEGANYVIAMAKSAETGSFGDADYLVKVFTAAGEVETLTIRDKKVTVNAETKLDADEAYELIDLPEDEAEEGVLAMIEVSAAGELIAFYTVDNDEDFTTISEEYASANDEEYIAKRKTYGDVDLDEKTLVFNIESGDDDLEDRITVTTALDLFVDGESYAFTAYGVENEAAKVLVTYDAAVSVNAEAPVMVVTNVKTTTVDDEKTVKLIGIVAGEEVTVTVDPEEEADVVKGNVVLYAMNSGLATDVAVLFSSTMDGAGELFAAEDVLKEEFSDEDVTIHYGLVTAKEAKYFEIDGKKFYYADEYNVTTIDYTAAKATIKAGKTSDIRAAKTEANNVYVFVKTVVNAEDEVSDIVVFKGLDAE